MAKPVNYRVGKSKNNNSFIQIFYDMQLFLLE